jgi:hypothetical protein
MDLDFGYIGSCLPESTSNPPGLLTIPEPGPNGDDFSSSPAAVPRKKLK